MQDNLNKTFEEELSEALDDADDDEQTKDKKRYEYIPQTFPAQRPEMTFIPTDIKKLDKDTEKQLLDFSALLDTISSLEDKKKLLWKQIYENAVSDRKNAYILFGDLYKDVHNKSNEHAIHGAILSKYMERMEKSNAQLIKLAEMIDDAADKEEDWVADEDDMYDRIQKMKK